MADIVSPNVRSRMMSGIQGKNTKPEIIIRKGLHAAGFRYRIHDKRLPGKPDMVFPKHRAVILANGCFWHKHNCHLFKWPSTRKEFWKNKLERNYEKDKENIRLLQDKGWRVLVIWECALKGKERLPLQTIINKTSRWLLSDISKMEIRGKKR